MLGQIHFDGRELKPFAQPVDANDLKVGEVYFFLNYVDDNLLIPTMETVVFIGKNLEPEDVGLLYFQDVQSYREGVRFDATVDDERMTISTALETGARHLFEFERALDGLLDCLLRRK